MKGKTTLLLCRRREALAGNRWEDRRCRCVHSVDRWVGESALGERVERVSFIHLFETWTPFPSFGGGGCTYASVVSLTDFRAHDDWLGCTAYIKSGRVDLIHAVIGGRRKGGREGGREEGSFEGLQLQ